MRDRRARASATTSSAARTVLFSGQSLASGASVTSPDGHYTLTMQSDGNLVLAVSNPLGSPRVIFSTGTGSSPGATALLQTNGNLIVRDSSGDTIWSNDVTSATCANLDLQDDGNLVLYNATGAYWASHTEQEGLEPDDELLSGQTLIAPGGDYALEMGTDGYLRLVDSHGTVWTSPQGGPAGSHAILYTDGDFEIRSPAEARAWYTETYSSSDADASVVLTSDGDIEVVTTAGDVAWSSATGATRSGLSSMGIPASFTSCPTATTTTTTTPTPPVSTPPIHVRTPTSGITAPARLPGVRVAISIRWRYDGAASWITSAVVQRFPRHGRLTITCAGRRGCPTRTVASRGRHRTIHLRFSAPAAHLAAMLRGMLGLRFLAGATVVFEVTEPGHRPARSQALIRRGRPPRSRSVS